MKWFEFLTSSHCSTGAINGTSVLFCKMSVSLSKSMMSILSVSSGMVDRTKVTVEMMTTDMEVKANIWKISLIFNSEFQFSDLPALLKRFQDTLWGSKDIFLFSHVWYFQNLQLLYAQYISFLTPPARLFPAECQKKIIR